jgi:hypothetical protein
MPTALITQQPRSTTPVIVFDSATTANLTNTSGVITGTAVDNDTELDQVGRFFLAVPTFASAPAASQPIEMYFVQSGGGSGTTYEDGSATVFPPIPVWVFASRAATDLKQASPPLVLPDRDFHVIMRNMSGQTMNAGWSLVMTKNSDEANW